MGNSITIFEKLQKLLNVNFYIDVESYLKLVKEFKSGVHGKFEAGGQSQKRLARSREEEEIRFYRRISVNINKTFLPIKNLNGIFVGGAGFSKLKFIANNTIDYRLKPKILDVVDIGYDGGFEGIRALVLKVKDKIKSVKYVQDKNIIQQFMNELSKDSGLAIYGYTEVKKLLEQGAVDRLILSEKSKKIYSLSSIAKTMGTKISIISLQIEEGEMLFYTFGGVVAICRYVSA